MGEESTERLTEQAETATPVDPVVAGAADSGPAGQIRAVVERYHALADAAADAVAILDPAYQLAHVNPHFAQMLGYAQAELNGKPLEHLLAGDAPLPTPGQAADARPMEPTRVELRTKASGTVWLELSVSPIVEDGELLGWLAIGRNITGQRRAEQRLLRANRELSAVQIVVADATKAIDLQATLDATLDQVLELLDAEVGAIFLLDERLQRLNIVVQRGLSRATVADIRGAGIRVGDGLVGRVVASGEPMLLENASETTDGRFAAMRDERLRSVACAPLLAEGKPVGAISIGRRSDQPFLPEEVRIFASIGSQVGMVIENARLHEELSQRANRLTILYHAGRQLAESATPSSIVSKLAGTAAQLMHSPAALVLTLEDPGIFRAAGAHGLPGARWRDVALGTEEGGPGQALRDGRDVVVADVAEDATMAAGLHERFPEMRSIAAVALRSRDKTTGVVITLHRAPHAYSEEDAAALSWLADQAAAAMEHARLHQEAESHAARIAMLNEIMKAAASSLDPEQVFRTLATQIKRLMQYDQLSIALLDDGAQTLEVMAPISHNRPSARGSTPTKLGDTVLGWVVANGRPLVREDLEREASFPWDGLLLAMGMHSDITVPLASRGRVFGALALASERDRSYSRDDLDLLQQIAGQVSVTIDNARLHQQVTADLRELNALHEMVEFFSAELDLDSLLHKVTVAAAKFVQADCGAIALLDDAEETATLKALHNLPASQLGREVRPGQGPLGQVLATRQPVLEHKYGERGPVPMGLEEMASVLAAPILWEDRLIGAFAVGSSEASRRLGARDGEMLRLLAKHVAIAIENARLHQKTRELAVVEERNRLARDIHDTLAQSLTGIVLQLENVADLIQERPEEALQELQEARALARRSLEEARQSVWGLHPTPLESMTLEQAIDREMRTLARQANLAAYFAVKGEARALTPDVETALFRIAQEALSNVRKHAAAKSIQGELHFDEQEVRLVIQDDGVGLRRQSTGTLPAGGFGLTSMRERARLLGGELRVESALGRGTRLTATVPYRQDAAPAANQQEPATRPPSVPAAESAIKVLVADDHPIARQGIRRLLEQYADIAVVGEAGDGIEAVTLSHELRPDVVLMDLQMPRLNGVEAIGQLREANLECRVLILSTYNKDEFLFDGIKAGAQGYLLKDVPAEDLVEAVRAVSRGESLLQGVVAGKLLDRLGRLSRGEETEELTDREMDVLRQVASGARNKEIARHLSIAEKTVKFHVANIFRKLGASSRTEVLAIALERGLIHT